MVRIIDVSEHLASFFLEHRRRLRGLSPRWLTMNARTLTANHGTFSRRRTVLHGSNTVYRHGTLSRSVLWCWSRISPVPRLPLCVPACAEGSKKAHLC